MNKFSITDILALLEKKETCFILMKKEWFYYIERGKVYRFELHHNQKARNKLVSYQQQKLTEETFKEELKVILIKQIQYDWLTDLSTEYWLNELKTSGDGFEVFFI